MKKATHDVPCFLSFNTRHGISAFSDLLQGTIAEKPSRRLLDELSTEDLIKDCMV